MSYDHDGQAPYEQPAKTALAVRANGPCVPHDEILDALGDRKAWEKKQDLYYLMRHDGVRRKNKPWPSAADMHYPLADQLIEKLKPYYIQQVFATETVATFQSLKPEFAQYATAAAQWFDYQLKQRSNFEEFLMVALDTMCQGGRAPVRLRWDHENQRLVFEAPPPRNIIVPSGTKNIADADWIVLVESWSKAAYKRCALFNQDPAFIAGLGGEARGQEDTSGDRPARERREGVTAPRNDREIILWTVHTRTPNGWLVRTYSPTRPDRPVRGDFLLPFTKGDFETGAPPFTQFSFELKEDGYYAARGVCERVAAFEASLNKDWNTMKDWQTLTCQPMFYSEQPLTNPGNLRFVPGQVLPHAINAVQFPSMPTDIGAQMGLTRSAAEQLVSLPDFGMGSQRSTVGGKKTATEVQAITAVMGQNADLRARLFRRELGRLLRLAWALLCQYASETRDYFYQDQLEEVPKEAFEGEFAIEPSGSGDNFNREFVVQKAFSRVQMFANNPYIDQAELYKSALEADDPRLVKRLYRPPQEQAATAMEDQAHELTVLLLGFPAVVSAADDDAAHLRCLDGFIKARQAKGEAPTPEQGALIAQHGLTHLEALARKNKRAVAEFAELGRFLDAMLKGAQAALQSANVLRAGAGAGAPQPE